MAHQEFMKRLALPRVQERVEAFRREVANRPTVADLMADLTNPPADGGPGAADESPSTLPLFLSDPAAVKQFDDRLDALIYGLMTGKVKFTKPAEEDNPIAFDPSGKDWDGIKAAAAHEASEDYTAPPVHVPTHSSAGQERTVPRLHGALTIWTDKTSRPSLWGRGD